MMEDITMLRIEHLTKTYGTKKAVDDLSLHIAPGSYVHLLATMEQEDHYH